MVVKKFLWGNSLMTYTLGIDIGIASVGFAGVNQDQKKILFCGVHIFEAAENPKDGASLATPRREKRGMRRVTGRRSQRKKQIRALLARHGLKDIESIDLSKKEAVTLSPWELRKAALERKLEDGEFARVLFHIAKRRGFQSNKKGNTEENDTEGKKVISGAIELEENAFKSGAKTIAAYLATQPKKRNGDGDYTNSIKRDAVREEIKLIFESQRKYGNEKATEELRFEYAGSGRKEERNTREGDGIAFFQRPLKSSEELVGECTFEAPEKRAPKFSYSAELFVMWSRLNNTRIKYKNGHDPFLTQEQKNKLVDLVHKQKEVTYKQAREKLDLSDDESFNISYRQVGENDDTPEKKRATAEKRVFLSLAGYHTLKEALSPDSERDWDIWRNQRRDDLDDIARVVTYEQDQDTRQSKLTKYDLIETQIQHLRKIEHFSKTVDLSLMAIKKILPYMEKEVITEDGEIIHGYDHAWRKIYGKPENKALELVPKFKDIPNPVVNRALAQTRKVINACIRKHGMPKKIIVELAREVGKPMNGYWVDKNGKKKLGKGNVNHGDRYIKGRRDIEKEQAKNWEKRRSAAIAVAIELGINPDLVSGGDILKHRLWEEQRHACIYCGNIIGAEKFKAADETQIDHILPYAKSHDDSYMNKVLVHKNCNQIKGDSIPFEKWSADTARWEKIVACASVLPKDKQERILMEEFDAREQGWKDRALNDTRYMAKELRNHLKDNLACKVDARNGAITAHLRGIWGFTDEKLNEIINILSSDKDEKDVTKNLSSLGLQDYHVKAALRIRDMDQANLKKALRGLINYKDRTNDRHHALDAIVIACSTEAMVQDVAKHNRYNKEKKHFPTPWPDTFRDDALAAVYGEEGEDGIRRGGIFVSRMPVRKISGAAHQETIRSIRKPDGKVIQRVKLKSLKLSTLENLVDRQRNIKLYNLLKERLEAHGDKPEKAFAEVIYMPVNDPSKPAPRVNSVRIETNEKSGIIINEGLASNGDMVRVDVFQVNGKFQLVPIYIHHFVQKKLPNRAIIAFKDEKDWLEVSDEDFIFSLYKNDLVRIKSKKEDFLGYYNGTHRGTGNINIRAHDSDPSFGKEGVKEGVGVKTLLAFEKYSVDYFGNKHRIVKEQRLGVAQCDDPECGGAVPLEGAVEAAE